MTVNPYYPPGLDVPGYVPNAWPVSVIVPVFFGILAVYTGGLVGVAYWLRPAFRSAPGRDQALFVWFAISGGLHCFFEGYFVLRHATLAGSQSVPAQLWKEYALSDSRYVTSDPFMLCIEGLTAAVYGPLCLATAASIAAANQSGTRYLLQAVMSCVHLYGVLLYYGTLAAEAAMRGSSHCRPEFLYLWVYFGGFNAPWVVVPLYALAQSVRAVSGAFTRQHDEKKTQ